MAGRPSDYSETLAAEICGRLASGEPLVKICRDESMPVTSTVYLWLTKHETFSDMYTRAREDQADTLADEIIDIADDGRNDTYEKDGVEFTNNDVIQRSRLRVDARKWIAAKLKPRKYGDKLELAGDKDAPLRVLFGSADANVL